jgi:hypothetical protein
MLQTLRFLPRHYDLVRELVSYDVCNVYRVRYVKVPGRCRSGKWREDLRIKQGTRSQCAFHASRPERSDAGVLSVNSLSACETTVSAGRRPLALPVMLVTRPRSRYDDGT